MEPVNSILRIPLTSRRLLACSSDTLSRARHLLKEELRQCEAVLSHTCGSAEIMPHPPASHRALDCSQTGDQALGEAQPWPLRLQLRLGRRKISKLQHTSADTHRPTPLKLQTLWHHASISMRATIDQNKTPSSEISRFSSLRSRWMVRMTC